RELAARYAARVRADPAAYHDVAHNAALRRERLDKRLAVTGIRVDDIAQSLERFACGVPDGSCIEDDAPSQPAKVAFIYAGNGAQWQGMGLALLRGSPRFASYLRDVDRRIQAHAGFSVISELQAPESASRLDEACIAQPLLFALQVAVTRRS